MDDHDQPVIRAEFSGTGSLGGIRREHFQEIQAADGRFWLVPKPEFEAMFADINSADEVYGVGDDVD